MPYRKVEDPSARGDALARVISDDGSGPYLSTVIAPSGYGKTRFLRRLLERGGDQTRIVYVSVLEAEANVRLFIQMLAAGIRSACPKALLAPLVQLEQGEIAEVDEYGARVAYVLSRILEEEGGEHLVLVIDDLDVLREGAPLARLVRRLVRSEPRGVRFVLSSMTSVPVDMETYRTEGTCAEVTSEELALDLAETQALLKSETGGKRYAPLGEEILEHTHGWPAVTLLLARVLSGLSLKEARTLVKQLPVSEGAVGALVVDQVLSSRRPPVQYAMKRLAVLESIDPDAAVALFKDSRRRGGQAKSGVITLKKAQVQELLKSLEQEQILYRRTEDGPLQYIPLVRDALRAILDEEDPEGIADAHQRLSAFYMERGEQVDLSAVDHLIAAGEVDRALVVLEEAAEELASSGRGQLLGTWLEALETAYANLP
ncbi:MAG: AAA family ATPase, partial [Myxococcota bacterium]|nr:AAA family ATPase [Myxococcota bacterium]